ncbi:hypothetical protein [Aquimarina macrocephali]|uniref:hypothetical protein n=1 Tax=Aquimarina macrocephali TaxID=666563 RepID=UPI0004B2D813|nr:hypothetical protein [Aquimarina macrocephali]
MALFGKTDPKSKKGKQNKEKNESIPVVWKNFIDITDIQNLRDQLIAHLSILADTPECKKILTDIINRASKVEIVGNRLVISILTVSNEIGKLVCSAPSRRDNSKFPSSYQEILKIHDGFSFPDSGPAAFDTKLGPYAPIFLNGKDVFTMYDPDSSEEDELVAVIDTHQDWFILDEQTKLSIDKPAVRFLSHGSSKSEIISKDYSIGGHFLRLIAITILGRDKSYLKLFQRFF